MGSLLCHSLLMVAFWRASDTFGRSVFLLHPALEHSTRLESVPGITTSSTYWFFLTGFDSNTSMSGKLKMTLFLRRWRGRARFPDLQSHAGLCTFHRHLDAMAPFLIGLGVELL